MRVKASIISLVALQEVGTLLVMFNARPHAPLGFWLWFSGLAVLAPFVGAGLYRRLAQRKTLR